jgi:benzoyl-CoA reductase/2-hydroxyglutaryl-CoA dehydratase subunit BcrC/BadD/HgdB
VLWSPPVSADIDRARVVAMDPVAAAREAGRRTGRPVVGAISSWVPDPLVLAAGGLTLRFPAGIRGRREGTRARAHFQASSCFYCRGILEMGLAGELDFVDALLFVQTCDTQQNLSDILKVAVPSIPVIDLYMPVNRRSHGAREYLLAEIRRASEELGAITGTAVDEAHLAAALETRGRLEDRLEVLYEARLESGGRVPAESFYAACVSASCLSPEESIPIIDATVTAIESGALARPVGAADVACVIAGSVIPYPGIYELLDALEVPVRDDDLSIGRRLFDHPVPDDGDPFHRVARSMLERSPGAVKHDTGMDRGRSLVGLARRARVKHVVLPLVKFCDPWAWDVPRLVRRLSGEGIGTLLVEIAGDEDLASGPVRNRVEAYFEMDRVGDLFDA